MGPEERRAQHVVHGHPARCDARAGGRGHVPLADSRPAASGGARMDAHNVGGEQLRQAGEGRRDALQEALWPRVMMRHGWPPAPAPAFAAGRSPLPAALWAQCSCGVIDRLRDVFAVDKLRDELLRNRVLLVFVLVRLARHDDVELRRLRRDDVRAHGLAREDELRAIALVDGDGRDGARHLHLATLAVDELDARHRALKDEARLVARVEGQVVHLAAHKHGAAHALEDVDALA
mmetsp:Transcript_11144/g.35152  ORF Transcript_11144/g.35152 Transcript_11144/m.35152 type:complete len:234 (-) Transcript_11144:187-888(-)